MSKVTNETCLTWLRAGYVEDQAKGYMTPTNYDGIPGKSMMSTVANQLGITERNANYYGDSHTHWTDPYKMPDAAMATALYDAYEIYRAQCRGNSKANKAKANGKDMDSAPATPLMADDPVPVASVSAILDRLEIIEAKIDSVLEQTT